MTLATTYDRPLLESKDIDVIERLLERKIDPRLRHRLFEYFGPKGILDAWRQCCAVVCDVCIQHCDQCGACSFDDSDPIIEQVLAFISCFELGVLDLEADTYRQVREKLATASHRYDPAAPF